MMNSPRWLAIIPLLLLLWIAHFMVDMMLGIWPIYKSIAQLDIAKAGIIVAIGAFIGEGSQIVFGSLSDRGYRKLFIIVGLLITGFGSLFAYFTGYSALFALYLLICIGSGCFHPSAVSLIGALSAERRGMLMTIFASGGSLGLASSQLIFQHVYHAYEGYTILLAIPSIAIAILLIIYRFTQAAPTLTTHKGRITDFVDFFKSPALTALYFSQVANQSILWGTIFILPDALKALGYNSWICHGGGHLCFILGGACMMIPGGILADKYSPKRVLLYAGFIGFATFYFILFSEGISNMAILSALFLLGASLALVNPIAISYGIRFAPERGGAISAFLMGLVWCVSESLGPGGVGLLTTFFSDYASIKALAILGSLFLIQIYATICLPTEEPTPVRIA
jgi:FSR family fosmidomycin resistance protein-like MFS transporter